MQATAASAPAKDALTEAEVVRPWHEYVEGLRYMRATPLIFGIALIGVGWATGGGAAQILFSLFGEIVFNRGPAGIGVHLGLRGHRPAGRRRLRLLAGQRASSFSGYKRTISICYVLHGAAYIVFSQMQNF